MMNQFEMIELFRELSELQAAGMRRPLSMQEAARLREIADELQGRR